MEKNSECMTAKSSFISMYVSYECLVPCMIIKACLKLLNVIVNILAAFPSVFCKPKKRFKSNVNTRYFSLSTSNNFAPSFLVNAGIDFSICKTGLGKIIETYIK